MQGKFYLACVVMLAAAIFPGGCRTSPPPPTTLVVRDAAFSEAWEILVHTVQIYYGIARERPDEGIIESQWFPKEMKEGAGARAVRRRMIIGLAPECPAGAERADFVFTVTVCVQKRRPAQGREDEPSQWRDFGRDVDFERELKAKLRAVLG